MLHTCDSEEDYVTVVMEFELRNMKKNIFTNSATVRSLKM
jgi:hypothetical protein